MNVLSRILAVLVLYLTSILQYDEDESTIIYHMAVFMSYFSPLFGAILSDSFLGKFKYVVHEGNYYLYIKKNIIELYLRFCRYLICFNALI